MKWIVCSVGAFVAASAVEFHEADALLQRKARDLNRLPEGVRRHFNSSWLFETSEAIGLGWSQDYCDRRAEEMREHVATNFLEHSGALQPPPQWVGHGGATAAEFADAEAVRAARAGGSAGGNSQRLSGAAPVRRAAQPGRSNSWSAGDSQSLPSSSSSQSLQRTWSMEALNGDDKQTPSKQTALEKVKDGCMGMFKVGTPASRCALASGASVSAISGLFFGGGKLDLKSGIQVLTDVGLDIVGTFFPIAGIVGGLFQACAMDFLFPGPPNPLTQLAEEIMKQAGIMMDKKIDFMLLNEKLKDVKAVVRMMNDDVHRLDLHREALTDCGFPTAEHTCSSILVTSYQNNLNNLFNLLRRTALSIFSHSSSSHTDAQWYYKILPLATVIAQLQATTILELANLPGMRWFHRQDWDQFFPPSASHGKDNWKVWSDKAIESVRAQIDNEFDPCIPQHSRGWIHTEHGAGKGGNTHGVHTGYRCIANSGSCFKSLLFDSVDIADETKCTYYSNHEGCSCNQPGHDSCPSCVSSDFPNACSTCDRDNVKARVMNLLTDTKAVFNAITSNRNVDEAVAKHRLKVAPNLIPQTACHRPSSPRRRCPQPVRDDRRRHNGNGGGRNGGGGK